MNELYQLTMRLRYAEYLATDQSTDNYYHIYMPGRGMAHICKHTGHIRMYCKGLWPDLDDTWRGGDVQPEHDRIVDGWLYNNYQAYASLDDLFDQIIVDNTQK